MLKDSISKNSGCENSFWALMKEDGIKTGNLKFKLKELA